MYPMSDTVINAINDAMNDLKNKAMARGYTLAWHIIYGVTDDRSKELAHEFIQNDDVYFRLLHKRLAYTPIV